MNCLNSAHEGQTRGSQNYVCRAHVVVTPKHAKEAYSREANLEKVCNLYAWKV